MAKTAAKPLVFSNAPAQNRTLLPLPSRPSSTLMSTASVGERHRLFPEFMHPKDGLSKEDRQRKGKVWVGYFHLWTENQSYGVEYRSCKSDFHWAGARRRPRRTGAGESAANLREIGHMGAGLTSSAESGLSMAMTGKVGIPAMRFRVECEIDVAQGFVGITVRRTRIIISLSDSSIRGVLLKELLQAEGMP
jgi:hypothetical protein